MGTFVKEGKKREGGAMPRSLSEYTPAQPDLSKMMGESQKKALAIWIGKGKPLPEQHREED